MGFSFPGNVSAPPNLLVPVIMLAWIPIVIFLFSRFPAQKAVAGSFVVAWLFLPEAAMPLPGIPDYTKMSATCYGILLATFIFDSGRFQSFRLGWVDIPMLLWLVCPFASSITNDLGAYDGISAVVGQTITWGIPYFLGRIYLNNLAGLRQLAIAMFLGGLAYVPFCLYEVRMSPQLHRIVYGGAAFSDFAQSIRMGGFRPSVFMLHGLAVGAFMMAATLIGIWLWKAGVVREVCGIPMFWLVAALLGTFVLLKSSGAYTLLVVGMVLLFIGWQFRTAVPVFVFIVGMCVYLYLSINDHTNFTEQLTSFFSNIYDEERMQSLIFRLQNEELLVQRAIERPIFGWAGWGRSLIHDASGKQSTIQDSLWILIFGQNGVVGLLSLFSFLLLPIASLFWLRIPASAWSRPELASAVAIAMALMMYAADCLLNAMINPIYVLAAGGLAGLVLHGPERIRSRFRQQVVSTEEKIPVATQSSR
jgi:hypothetical protein